MLLGHTCVCAVEWDKHARQVLLARQRDGCLPRFPIWDDVQTFDGKPWRGRVDVVCGGFPCQDISAAGKGAGIDGERSGMWHHMARIVGEIRPSYVFVENSPMLTSRGLGRVLGDLAALGYDAEWCVLGAHHAGAPHKRDRIWILANADLHGRGNVSGIECAKAKFYEPSVCRPLLDNTYGAGLQGAHEQPEKQGIRGNAAGPSERKDGWWATEPSVGRVANGVANRVDRLKRIGNGQVPAVAALAFQVLSARLG